jgi:uncharacterized membrane protein YtjA (UPF0391 family)
MRRWPLRIVWPGICNLPLIVGYKTAPAEKALILERIETMLSWALTFLVIALIAAFLGFGVIAGTAAGIAKILFVVFLVLFIVSMLGGRRGPVV